ncbi:heme-binding protein [Mycobacterium kyorinense]|uniref:Heme-binding protein n=1 Tax=Mycobacterium kyorinense TaxID=487514 RepID=A0A1X1XPY7_9MYCO|nr:heme-binding protein [Mycobacterium kyorinense]ORW00915.1 heme-binding protein [Mycobacterium kyorinense]
MLKQVLTLICQLLESVPSVVGIRSGTEQPLYRVEPLTDEVEIRRYGPRIAAETTVRASEEAARHEGFRRLAGYIFGANHSAEKIAMTAPVGQYSVRGNGQKIAMTAPVAQSGNFEQGWVIRFFMPAKWTMDTLPVPVDTRVRLVELPAQTVAVLSFSGGRGPDAVAARTAQLREVLRAYGFEPAGEPTAWFYDPPWTVPFRRRNEIAIPISCT